MVSRAMHQISQPFILPVEATPMVAAAPLSNPVPAILFSAWFCGFVVSATVWYRWWRRFRVAIRASTPLHLGLPIPVMTSPDRLEPGVFGIWNPILLLPEGIGDRLTAEQLQSILAHELCHVRHRDNLAAAVHMLVESIFWFHPWVWWIGKRLVEERERACDEEVMRMGNEPKVYAEGILNVCKFYLQSPLTCASGVTGANLKRRIEAIVNHRLSHRLTLARKLVLAGAGMAAVAGPILIGILNVPQSRGQSTPERLTFEVASVKPGDPNARGVIMEFTPGGGVRVVNGNLRQIMTLAYDVDRAQISGGPGWLESEKFSILAKATTDADGTGESTAEQRRQARLRLQSLLADRFHLTVHRDTREAAVYALEVAKNGPRLKESGEGFDGLSGRPGQVTAERATIQELAAYLSGQLRRSVLDETGLKGTYAFKLEWSPNYGSSNAQSDVDADKAAVVGAAVPDPSGPSIFNALQAQLGLRLQSRRRPVESIVIDRAERPSGN